MEKMEVEEEEQSSSESNRVAEAATLWSVINNPIVGIFSDLTKPGTEQGLRSFLESMTRSSSSDCTLFNILIPPFRKGSKYEVFQRQYTTFTTWLFGILFHVVVTPLSKENLQSTIEIQTCMLRILYRLHFEGFRVIFTRYMAILDGILEFAESKKESIVIKDFIVEANVIEGLDLMPYPPTLNSKSITAVFIAIMKILLKSGVMSANPDVVWEKILKILKIAEPEAKLVAVQVLSEMTKFHEVDEKQLKVFLAYNMEIMKTITPSTSVSLIKPESVPEYAEILAVALENIIITSEVTDLCFSIVELVSSRVIVSQRLQSVACMKIRNYLMQHPSSYTSEEVHRFTRYFENCPEFTRVLAHYVAFDLKALSHPGSVLNAATSSALWQSLVNVVFEKPESPEFPQHLNKLLKIARLLTTWLAIEENHCRFFENCEDLVKHLFSTLEKNSNQDSDKVRTIFMGFIDMLALKEFNRDHIQSILLLPWSQARELSILGDAHGKIAAIAKSLDNATKIKCLEGICELGRGKLRIKYLSPCITSTQMDFGVPVVLNSVLLLQDPEISFLDVNTHILKPALITQRPTLQEAVAEALGAMVCVLSGKARVTRNDWDSKQWCIHCELCNEEEYSGNFQEQTLNIEHETLLRPYFNLLTLKNAAICSVMVKNLLKFSNHLRSFNTNDIATNWLPLLRHPSPEIRNDLANSIEKLVKNRIVLSGKSKENKIIPQDEWPEELKTFVEIIIKEIGKTLDEALENSKESQHMTVLKTVKEFARVPIYFVEGRICTIFIISIIHSNSMPAAVAAATVAYKEVAGFAGLNSKDLYVRYKKDLMEVMIKMAADNFIRKSDSLAMTFHRVASCIGYLGPREFLRKNGHLAMSFLAPLAIQMPKLQELFPEFAHLLGTFVKDMFLDYFQHICSHVLVNESPAISTKCLKLAASLAESTLHKRMAESFQDIFRELLLHFHEKMERVIHCLEIISQFDRLDGKKQVFDSQRKLADYLKPRLHAVLVNFDSNLSSTTSDDFTQRSALASLATLIKFMGAEHLSPLKYKILATLRTSLSFTRPGFQDLACYAWDSFIRNLSLEDLGPLLPTICVSLIPLLESYPEKTNSMLEYLIIENNTSISMHISELFFIDDLKVSPRITNIVILQIKRSTPIDNFEASLKLWQRRIVHETDEVRLKALIYFKKFLAKHRSELNEMILNDSNHVHPEIVQLLDGLLAGCQHSDDEIKLKSGECLGELGAIEPSLLPRRIVSRKDSKFIAEMNEVFAGAMLIELVRAFQIQNSTQNVDCFCLAIQEILKTYEIAPDGVNSELWHSLPSTTQQIIIPFLESHYKATTLTDPVAYPIYGTEAGLTFDKWIYSWACCMITSIKDPDLASLLHACRPALKRDTRTTVFCIPYIVTYTVIAGDDRDRDGLLKEILAVIRVENQKLDQELVKKRPLWNELHEVKSSESCGSDEERRIRCSQVIFATLDHLRRWLKEKRLEKGGKYNAVDGFFSKLDNLVLADGCYQSHEYHRALMYLERHMGSSKKALDDPREGGLLAKIYTMLEDPDGVSGILASQAQSPTMQQLVLAHEVNDQLQDAATCYERLAQRQGESKYVQGMIQCYLGLEQPFTATKITQGMLNAKPELEPLLVEHEPFWRLAQYSHLDVKTSIKTSFVDSLTRGIQPDLQAVKKSLVSQLGAASHRECAYQQNYSHVMKLHIINEFEKTTELILKEKKNLPKMLKEWAQRLELVRGSRGVEFVLRMRRAALDLAVQVEEAKMNQNQQLQTTQQPYISLVRKEIGKIWLKSAKIARKAGLYQQAYMYILSASDHCPPQELHIEQAQLYWQKGSQEDAFITLKRAFSRCFQPLAHYKVMPTNVYTDERKHFAKANLLLAKYNEETVNVDPETNRRYYKETVEAWKGWEKSHLACAQYNESILNRMSERDRDGQNGVMIQCNLVNSYAKSVQFGCRYIHQSMPRMLTIWMNYALRVHTNREPSRAEASVMLKMSQLLGVYVDRLPKFTWLTVFSQLVSRICHPAEEVQKVINTVLVNLILAYPQYCLWMMASVINSSYPVRQKRCQDILNSPRLDTTEMRCLIKDFNRLWEKLIELSNKPISQKLSHTSVSVLSKNLPRLLAQPGFGPIMMPTSTFCQLHLPHSKVSHDALYNHNPFPMNCVSITGISDKVMVLLSLQRPRRISLLGSDGKEYLFMCKPKDDLRRDFRLMEFNSIVNKYLQKDPESRQRRLYIRTYSVIPLNEECGLVEWIRNLTGFRPAIIELYRERGINISNRDLVSMLPQLRDSIEKKREIFLKKLLPRHPPVLGYWFRLNFPDAYGWYEARNAYIRTTAVMSMVGYILGLGDRHGENILFDSKCGDCVHVDFNCLFNKGESLEWPERVPFRLTHNMVEAMGPLGYEGSFRRSCQITMRILRQQASTLISVLTPFVYDPLVIWSKNQATSDTAEKTNEKAVKNIKDIELRLKGFVRTQGNSYAETAAVSLSVEGQTNHLILDATNIDNLCQMWSGWSAFV